MRRGRGAVPLARGAVARGLRPAITATDVSADALGLAARAAYPVAAWNGIPAEWRDDFVLEG